MIAKGTPRDRYICHVDEGDKKRYLTYSSEGRANSAFKHSGFYLSDYVKDYIRKEYPTLVSQDGWMSWNHIQHLFKAKEFVVKYEAVNQKNIE